MVIDHLELAAVQVPPEPPYPIVCGKTFSLYLRVIFLCIGDCPGDMSYPLPVHMFVSYLADPDVASLPHLDHHALLYVVGLC